MSKANFVNKLEIDTQVKILCSEIRQNNPVRIFKLVALSPEKYILRSKTYRKIIYIKTNNAIKSKFVASNSNKKSSEFKKNNNNDFILLFETQKRKKFKNLRYAFRFMNNKC